jgi:hypothetical protein
MTQSPRHSLLPNVVGAVVESVVSTVSRNIRRRAPQVRGPAAHWRPTKAASATTSVKRWVKDVRSRCREHS